MNKNIKTFESFIKEDIGDKVDYSKWFAQLPLKTQLEITGLKHSGNTEAMWHETEAEWYSMNVVKKKEWYDKIEKEK